MGASSSSWLLCFLSLALLFVFSSSEGTISKVVDLDNPIIHFLPLPLVGYSSTDGAKEIISCDRVQIAGVSRLIIRNYANAFRIILKPSELISEKLHSKIEVCFHRNISMGLCQCTKDDWRSIQEGSWSNAMSPYEDRYVDVKFVDGVSGPITISVEEEFQQWRLFCLGFGFVLLLLAPIVSSWVPFYYSSSMALGVLLVILILLFQGMKLLPTGRKNVFYLTIYGSVLGAGSFLVHYFSVLINSILGNFGLSEDMHNPVSVFVLLGIFIAGAALGYWIVRKFVLSEDGRVDVDVAHFVKWAMRVIAMVSIFQSTLDSLLAMAALSTCWGICFLITSKMRRSPMSMQQARSVKVWQHRARQGSANRTRAEFLSRSPKMGSGRTAWGSQNRPYSWSNSPIKGLLLSSPQKTTPNQQDYYSTFHKVPTRKRFSKKEWEDFTSESTKQALAEWASSPEFTDWIVEHADRIQLLPDESSDDSMVSGSDSSEETVVESGSGLSLFKWASSSFSMANRRHRGPIEREAPNRERDLRDIEIEELRCQVQTLTERLALQEPQDEVEENNESESDVNPFAQPHQRQRESDGSSSRRPPLRQCFTDVKVEVPEFEGKMQPDIFIEWLTTVEQISYDKEVPDEHKFSLLSRNQSSLLASRKSFEVLGFLLHSFSEFVFMEVVDLQRGGGFSWSFGSLIRRKQVDSVQGKQEVQQLAKKLSLLQLIVIGVGTTIGSGIYVLVGTVAREHSGPALTISFLIAGVAAALSAFCYAELASRCPSAGSAYHYSYICVGEGVAWLIGWALILEYTIGGSAVARGISPNLALFFGGQDNMPTFLARTTIPGLDIVVDPCAAILVLIVTCLLCVGIKESALAQSVVTTTNVCVMVFVIIAGAYVGFQTKWIGYSLPSGYFPFGINGMLAGSATVFFAYVGFDAVVSTAEEVKNPRQDLPLGIGIALSTCCFLYMSVSVIIVGLVPYYAMDPDTPISSAFSIHGMQWAMYIITTGAVTALCSALIGMLLPQPRILMAMARDGLLPPFFSDINKHTQVPVKSTIVTGICAATLAFCMDVSQLAGMVSVGTLLAFTIVALSILILRYVPPDEVPMRSSLKESIDSVSLQYNTREKNAGPKYLVAASMHSNQHSQDSMLYPNDAEESDAYPLIVEEVDRDKLKDQKRRRAAALSITIVCIGVLLLTSGASAEFFPSFVRLSACLVGGLLLLCGLIVLFWIDQDDGRHSFGHTGGFMCPFVPLLPVSCILINVYLLINLSTGTWIRVSVWLVIGVFVYLVYGQNHSSLLDVVYVPTTNADEIYGGTSEILA
ncbi:uncharacterized protein LOC143888166 [Tasmannia lanceolata]|uniref:uncharacterized protein LOC143888166 n=1 Tax=Tasmannia lanceolata TaxID=3420 RepID=UPI004063DD28